VNPIPQIRLTGRAARFVELLGEYGHLDAEAINRVLLGAAELKTDGADVPVDVDIVRKAAAMLLFPGLDSPVTALPASLELAVGPTALAEDWPLLFS